MMPFLLPNQQCQDIEGAIEDLTGKTIFIKHQGIISDELRFHLFALFRICL